MPDLSYSIFTECYQIIRKWCLFQQFQAKCTIGWKTSLQYLLKFPLCWLRSLQIRFLLILFSQVAHSVSCVYSFEKFLETTQNYVLLDLLANFVSGFLGAGGLISGKDFITVRKQGHDTVGQTDQIHQPFNSFLTADPVSSIDQKVFPS